MVREGILEMESCVPSTGEVGREFEGWYNGCRNVSCERVPRTMIPQTASPNIRN